ncbi:MAG: hypothetical protein DRJ01_15500, partial [Bacteroidetes bacterium]
TYDLPEIDAGETIDFSCELGHFSDSLYITRVILNFPQDINLDNNVATTSFLVGVSPIILNELMFKPSEDNQEWIEIFNRSHVDKSVDNFRIIDKSGGSIKFSGTIRAYNFLLICQNYTQFIESYPSAIPDKIIEAQSWTSLNNTDETLSLQDNFSTELNFMQYSGENSLSDISLERVNPFSDENIQWLNCQDSLGGTPTFPNSVLPFEKDIEIAFLGLDITESYINHKICVKNIGLNPISSALLTCYKLKDDDIDEVNIWEDEISLSDSTEYSFQAEKPVDGYYTFHYELYSEEDLFPNNNSDFTFYNDNSLPFVVNEIMYNPNEPEPEWLELKINEQIPHLNSIFIVVGNDTLKINFPNKDYLIITSSYDNAEYLKEKYDLSDLPMMGLPSLSDTGKQISLMDNANNMIESFFYEPDWNDDEKGVSIERVNPYLPAEKNNWGPSISNCSPGKQNSIYVQVLPQSVKFSASPNPFSPFSSKRTIFYFQLPEKVSRTTIRIFDLKGRLVKKIINQIWQPAEGNIIWDGKGDNGKNLPIGVYVVLLEATSRETEKVYSKTTTVVIGK